MDRQRCIDHKVYVCYDNYSIEIFDSHGQVRRLFCTHSLGEREILTLLIHNGVKSLITEVFKRLH